MYASIIGMPLGILWAMYERKIDSYFEIGFLRKEIVAIVAFVILFIGRLTLSVVGFDNQLFQSVLRNIITIAFIVPLIELLKKVKINNETQKQISRIVGKDVPLMPELALRDEYKNLPIRKEKNDILKIVFVGRLIGKKGIAFLVDALSLMPTDMDWELLIFGDGDDRALIEKQIADSSIGKNVKLMGNRPLNQIAEAYQQADVFVLPSLRETSGNVLLEAMAYAVPIVAFDTSFCRLLKEVDCGVFINTEQALDNIKEDYCKAIVTLGQDKELAKQMGLNGYKYVNSKLTWDEKYRIIVNDM